MDINAAGIIFSNMHDEEMHEITNCRTMGALPFGGRYRLVDFALSNMRNSGLTSVGIVAKSNYQSLLEHLGSGKEWDLSRKRDGLFIFPPFSRLASGIYKNKIEALHGILSYIKKSKYDYILITDCDVICNLDWKAPLSYHISKKADVTVIYFKKQPGNEKRSETVYTISKDGFVSDILIKQKVEEPCFIGTNMWIMEKNTLINMINDAVAHNLEDIERDIFQKRLNQFKIAAWEYKGYINKINSILDYYQANIDLLSPKVRKELFYKNAPIYTKVLDVVPAKYADTATVSNSLISDGCIIEGQVENSILFRGVHIGKGSAIKNSIIMKDSKTGNNVKLDYVIADKEVIFRDERIMVGCDTRPIYIGKGSTL
ncbi:glucose-1-phosphate adenylyltransferase subunit GlgD [Anaerocolumna cellulosilytica]|uniref:Glucose-1-phosphate adenylyltransferase subunit GlgD n=1 Tax=Anaerocolumna cellulosilytica TaxID=433286 RepID=A0A6S6R132_9FIRM|nr:glucose-1-phosphate adenylyltransferase subunit GlgD [Anaerocolumna cellulosilytica]MBB5197778.1 glucose-1-phosphate adenylyltransferase [Anaerocolumna cellulosilytica]BCJ93010.1 glucose-1-phosphate adenylyltransferase subunit GlgD [Anaerocolumna cellulosilytica]